MSINSNRNGRAYEFAFLAALKMSIAKIRKVSIREDKNFQSAERAFNEISDDNKRIYTLSALSAIHRLFELEPRILENGNDTLELYVQADKKGGDGDVRDIVIARKDIAWEIGLSVKHNNFAVKHSRVSNRLDFGKKWYGIPCSKEYWTEVKPVFDMLVQKKSAHIKFDNITDKDLTVYVPILNAFVNEIKRQTANHPELPVKLVEYLLGKYDFYKVISIDNRRMSKIQSFNLHGTLNLSGRTMASDVEIPIVELPKRIIAFEFKPNSTNTLELYMDGGWQFTFRIHSGDSIACPSLKFDVQVVGMPTTILTLNCLWN